MCGARVAEGPAREAPFAERIAPKQTRRGFRIAGGVLTIIASCFCLLTAIVGLIVFYGGYGFFTYGIIGVFAFALGLTAGILTLVRKAFYMAIVGEISVLTAAGLTFLPAPMHWYYYSSLWVGGVVIFPLILLGLIFTAVAQRDFK